MCVGRDSAGKNRFFTPDILVRRPFAVVEVDPARWHGAPEKVAEDIMRNRFYAARGLRVVRVRIDGTEALSPNDVVIAESDFVPERHGTASSSCARHRADAACALLGITAALVK